jgi:hypothetical protein
MTEMWVRSRPRKDAGRAVCAAPLAVSLMPAFLREAAARGRRGNKVRGSAFPGYTFARIFPCFTARRLSRLTDWRPRPGCQRWKRPPRCLKGGSSPSRRHSGRSPRVTPASSTRQPASSPRAMSSSEEPASSPARPGTCSSAARGPPRSTAPLSERSAWRRDRARYFRHGPCGGLTSPHLGDARAPKDPGPDRQRLVKLARP